MKAGAWMAGSSPAMTVQVRGLAARLLQLVDAFRGFSLGQLRVVGVGIVRLFGERLEVGRLRARHRLVSGDPIVRIFLLVGIRVGERFRILDLGRVFVPPARLLVGHYATPCSWI